MKTKIDWFKEVLEMEPGSKVFFPLARLYYEDGLLDEAEETLLQGLERNADHLEARFLLAEILDKQGEAMRAADEVQAITRVLSRYPSFWQLWAGSAAPASKDSAMALSFLAAHFQGRTLSWSQIIEKGLDALVADGAAVVSSPARRGSVPAAAQPDANLRTRTMADLLAGQGDPAGALDIYEELLAKCAPGEEGDLPERVALMRSELGLDQEPGEDAGDDVSGGLEETVSRFLQDLVPQGAEASAESAIEADGEDLDDAPDFDELAELEASPDFDGIAPGVEAVAEPDAVHDLEDLDTLLVEDAREPAEAEPEPAAMEADLPEEDPVGVEAAVAARMPGKDQLLQTLEALAERLEARSAMQADPA